METYGYVRVSSKDQNEDRQIIAMHKLGIEDPNIFIDKQSGKDFLRPQYERLLRKLRQGDVLYIKSIDRLGRNYEEDQQQWWCLTKKMQVDVVVIDMPILDTRREKNLVGTLIADIVLQILSFVAENERINIHARQQEGIAAARARGVRFGPPEKPLPEDFPKIYRLWKQGRLTGAEAAKVCNVSRATFYRRAAKQGHRREDGKRSHNV